MSSHHIRLATPHQRALPSHAATSLRSQPQHGLLRKGLATLTAATVAFSGLAQEVKGWEVAEMPSQQHTSLAGLSTIVRCPLPAGLTLPVFSDVCTPQFTPPANARALLAGDPVKNANAILRYALPIDNKPIRDIQVSNSRITSLVTLRQACIAQGWLLPLHACTPPHALTLDLCLRFTQGNLESISKALRIPGSKSLGPVVKAIKNSQNILAKQRPKIEADFAPEKRVGSSAAELPGVAVQHHAFQSFERVHDFVAAQVIIPGNGGNYSGHVHALAWTQPLEVCLI